MKNLFLVLLLSVFGLTTAFAQQDDYKGAGKELKKIESTYIKSGTDAKAVKLITAARESNKAEKEYLASQPNYASLSKAEQKALAKKLAKADEKFKALRNARKDANKAKQAYLGGINAEYKKLLDAKGK